MADTNAFSPEDSGSRLAERDQLYNAMQGLQQQKMMGEIAKQPAEADLARAHARLFGAQAAKAEREERASGRLETDLQDVELPKNPADALYEMANRAARSGAFGQATTMLQRASTATMQAANAQRSLAQGAKAQIETQQKILGDYANMLGPVVDQESMDRVNQRFEQQYGMPAPLKGQTFDPQKVIEMRDSTLTAHNRLDAQLKKIEQDGRDNDRRLRDQHNTALEDIRRQEAEARRKAAEAREKAGGGVVNVADKDRKAAERFLQTSQPNLDAQGRKLAADSIASRAAEIVRTNRGKGIDQAIQEAYNEEVEGGSFAEGSKKILGVDVPGTSKTTFSGGGRSPATPLILPTAQTQMKKGRFYRTQRGIAKWNGEAFDDPTGAE